jgi:hypothetical protein
MGLRQQKRLRRLASRSLKAVSALLVLTAATNVVAIAIGSTPLSGTVASSGTTLPPSDTTTTTTAPLAVRYVGNAPGITVVPPQTFDLPDPMLLTDEGHHYLFFSSAFGDHYAANVPELVDEAGQWTRWDDALPRVPGWALSRAMGGGVWDPYVVRIRGRYLMYFSAQLNSAYRDPSVSARLPIHCLGTAFGPSPVGPFVPAPGPPIVCQQSAGGDIDIQPVNHPQGPDGPAHPWYLVWKSDGNNLWQGPPAAIWSAGLSDDGLSLTTRPGIIFQADQYWEKPVIEAPQMVDGPDGSLWLFFSAGTGFFSANYGMGAARCRGPLGPCVSSGPPLVSSNAQGQGPGEETVFVGPGGSYWLLYNPWHTGLQFQLFRPVEAVRIGWDQAGPYVVNTSDTPLSDD